MAAAIYFCTVALLSQSHDARMVKRNLIINIHQDNSHTTDPFPKAILEQKVTVKTQTSNMVLELGSFYEKPNFVCQTIFSETKRLQKQIVAKAAEWYHFEKEKEENAKTGAKTGQNKGGWVVVEEAEVEIAGS
ncbi:MAG: hypothetical protein Q9175_006183 [Cornicularia normoerica]